MARAKIKDWEVGVDGPIPMCSSRCVGLQPVRISDDDGEHFGWETPDGNLIIGSLVAPSPAKQAELDAINLDMQNQITANNARRTALDALRTKREADTPLDATDHEVIADIILGRL